MARRKPPQETVTDPVCGMDLDTTSAVASVRYHGQEYFFCTEDCLEQFKADPRLFVDADAQTQMEELSEIS